MKVVSFCLYGTNRMYYDGFLENVDIIRRELPEYEIYVYVGNIPSDWHIPPFVRHVYTNRDGCANMLYRFKPIEFADIGFVRDTDSRITSRDLWCMRDFLQSDFSYHTIRDHFYHTAKISGGMMGWKQTATLPEFPADSIYGTDELFLETFLYPKVIGSLLVHTTCYVFPNEHVRWILPSNETKEDFIGNVRQSTSWRFIKTQYEDHILHMTKKDDFQSILHIASHICPTDIPVSKRTIVYDAIVIACYYLDTIKELQRWLGAFIYADITQHTITNSNYVFAKLGRIVGCFDPKRTPSDNEVVIVYGNYPVDHLSLPATRKVFRHVSFFRDVKHDIVESHPCWDFLDAIYILNLEERVDRYWETLISLAHVHAPLQKIYHYKAQKTPNIHPYSGATENHVKVIRTFLESTHTNCLILEDDIVFIDDVQRVWDSIVEFTNKKYSIPVVFLSISRYGERETFDDILSNSKQSCTTSSAYFLQKSSAQAVFDIVNEGLQLSLQTNGVLGCIDRHWCGRLNMKYFTNKLVFQRPGYSNLRNQVVSELD